MIGGKDGMISFYRPQYQIISGHVLNVLNSKINDICLIRYKGIRSNYRLGRVIDAPTGKDGLVRNVKLQYGLPEEKTFRCVERSVHGIYVIVPIEEQ